ncbi:MAG: hypothetical protein E6R08_09710 [Nevskiaceae bacterium]|nr:MAG: hypothetical protein E6R08_09710 [Nevskiaceae bacterium]
MSDRITTSGPISQQELALYGPLAVKQGYLVLEGAQFCSAGDIADLKALQESCFRLPSDTNGGQRFRAYRSFTLTGAGLKESETQGYQQSKQYNYTEGGKLRTFQPIEPGVRALPLLRKVIAIDAAIVKATGIVSFDAGVKVGVHQVRYQPENGVPSYSSPPWLHKDDEPAVFVHLLNLSANSTGGDSVLAGGNRDFHRVLKLVNPFDTLFLTQNLFHAVTPVGIEEGTVGFRDILIVTFEPVVEEKLAA